ALLVGIGQRAARHPTANPTVIAPRSDRTQTGNSLAQAGPARDLGEDHAEQLVHAREAAQPMLSAVTFDGVLERAPWEQFDQLGEDRPTLVRSEERRVGKEWRDRAQ